MEIREFAKKVCMAVEKELGESYTTELKEVKKNNGVMLHGLLILSREHNVVPTIYLDSFWEAYEEGTPFSVIIRSLLRIYEEDTPKSHIDVNFFTSFERVKNRICYKLIGKKGNEELLEEIPYVEFFDLAICFFYAYRGEGLGEGSILIYNSHLDLWKTSVSELFVLAGENTPKLFEWECNPMEAVLSEELDFAAEGDWELLMHEIPMKVLSNKKRIHGAACILYPGLLEKLAINQGGSYYILPSSVHELILLKDSGAEKPENLKRMIREVNHTLVAPEEVLSDTLYYYDFAKKEIKRI